MVPPVKRYRSSQRQYQSQPKRWDYGPGAEVRRLNSAGCLSEGRRRWFVCQGLAERDVALERPSLAQTARRVEPPYFRPRSIVPALRLRLVLPLARAVALHRRYHPAGLVRAHLIVLAAKLLEQPSPLPSLARLPAVPPLPLRDEPAVALRDPSGPALNGKGKIVQCKGCLDSKCKECLANKHTAACPYSFVLRNAVPRCSMTF